MFSLKQIKQCIENCKIAGDIERSSKEFMLAAVMIIFSIDNIQNKNQLIIIKKKNNLKDISNKLKRYSTKNLSEKNSLEIFKEIGINTVQHEIFTNEEQARHFSSILGFPIAIKF